MIIMTPALQELVKIPSFIEGGERELWNRTRSRQREFAALADANRWQFLDDPRSTDTKSYIKYETIVAFARSSSDQVVFDYHSHPHMLEVKPRGVPPLGYGMRVYGPLQVLSPPSGDDLVFAHNNSRKLLEDTGKKMVSRAVEKYGVWEYVTLDACGLGTNIEGRAKQYMILLKGLPGAVLFQIEQVEIVCEQLKLVGVEASFRKHNFDVHNPN